MEEAQGLLPTDSHSRLGMIRPPKRARVDADVSNTPSQSPQVKCEDSPSPLTAERKLITSGTKRFAPVPNDCLPVCTEYRQNRSEWVSMCVKELEGLDLVPERRLFRDDGLVIDWKSHVPVWSDTLKPNTQDLAAAIVFAHKSNAQWHPAPVRKESPPKSVPAISAQDRLTSPVPTPSDLPDDGPSPKKRFPVPPRPSSKRRNIPVNSPSSGPGISFPRPEIPRFPDEKERATQTPSQDRATSSPVPLSVRSDTASQHDHIGVPTNSYSSTCDQSAASDTYSTTEEEMSKMTLDYLRRYVQTYESDRASLASAYASNASFAYRVHHITGSPPSAWAASPRCFSTTLLTLPCLHGLGTAQIEYDIFYLGAELGMFVVCRVTDSTKTVAHNFILHRKEVDVEDATIEGVWPLTANAHQILVFET